jgi:hypothetical protein
VRSSLRQAGYCPIERGCETRYVSRDRIERKARWRTASHPRVYLSVLIAVAAAVANPSCKFHPDRQAGPPAGEGASSGEAGSRLGGSAGASAAAGMVGEGGAGLGGEAGDTGGSGEGGGHSAGTSGHGQGGRGTDGVGGGGRGGARSGGSGGTRGGESQGNAGGESGEGGAGGESGGSSGGQGGSIGGHDSGGAGQSGQAGAAGTGEGGAVAGGGAHGGGSSGGGGAPCPEGQQPCLGRCVDTAVDPNHCGDCQTRCPPGNVCAKGNCELSCQVGLTNCVSICTDLLKDEDNCGSCGNRCGTEEHCKDGSCQCRSGQSPCGDACVDLRSDRSHCGRCGQVCPDGEVCSAGACQPTCALGLTDCSGSCVELRRDTDHCGACNQPCVPGEELCWMGKCICPGGQSLCSGACTDIETNPAHCGGCDVTCGSAEVCSSGTCRPAPCPSEFIDCNGACVDLSSDRSHCGACDVSCSLEESCRSGSCGCPGSQVLCGDTCTDARFDPANCGGCGVTCSPDELCSFGTCQVPADTAPRCQSTLDIGLNAQTPFSDQTSQPTCELLPGGAGRMTYVLPTGNGPFAACVFANGVNLSGFDADQGFGGVMEIDFCTSHTISGELNLWYGAYPTRKRLQLVRSSETLDPGCYTVRHAPEQAVCHWTARPEWSGECGGADVPGLDKSCRNCGSSCNQGCALSFSSTRLTLIAEQAALAQATPVQIDLEALRFLPEDCTCTNDGRCSESPDRTECLSGLFSSAVCPSGAPVCGVCIPPAPSCTLPLSLCGGACVDTQRDEQNCGGCGVACNLPSGIAACVGGVCRTVACDPGYGDPDGIDANGCECKVTNGGTESCDRVDNDCDGIVDWAMQPLLHNVCECLAQNVTLNRSDVTSPTSPEQCRATSCTPLPSGVVEMSYCFSNACSSTFATCVVADHANLSQFDVDFGNDGVLEVVFETLGPVAGKLNLNYGIHPRRKYVPLIRREETLASGFHVKYFAPEQVLFSSSSPICQESCGSCPQIHNDPNFTFGAADVTLVAEGCAVGVDARVRLHSVRVVSRGCDCVGNANCGANPQRAVCRPPNSGVGSCGWPGTFPPGICG